MLDPVVLTSSNEKATINELSTTFGNLREWLYFTVNVYASTRENQKQKNEKREKF